MSEARHSPGTEAYALLASELASFHQLSYEELVHFVGTAEVRRVRGSDSTQYAIQVTVEWRTGEPGDILVVGWCAVDDCGPLRRLDESFIVHRPC